MSTQPHNQTWVVVFSFTMAMMLEMLPLPLWAMFWQPDWIALVLIYWALALPKRIGVLVGWHIGILQDVITDSLLGQHAMTLAIQAFLAISYNRQVRLFPLWQQALGIFSLIFFAQVWFIWIRGITGQVESDWRFIYPAFSSMLLWPWIYTGLRDLQQNYHVS
jgi:rod shape-determining protein MreD